MLPDPAELKRLSETCTYSDWPFAGVLAAEVIRLRERLATVEGERDEARAEVERLREQANPATPAGKLAAYRAAEAMVESPPKVALPWAKSKIHPDYKVRLDLTGECAGWARLDGCWRTCGLYGEEKSIELAVERVNDALAAAGWELVGDPDV